MAVGAMSGKQIATCEYNAAVIAGILFPARIVVVSMASQCVACLERLGAMVARMHSAYISKCMPEQTHTYMGCPSTACVSLEGIRSLCHRRRRGKAIYERGRMEGKVMEPC